MKTYHIYKRKDNNEKEKKIFFKSGKPEIVRIGLVDYIYDDQEDCFIPFEEVYGIERRKK